MSVWPDDYETTESEQLSAALARAEAAERERDVAREAAGLHADWLADCEREAAKWQNACRSACRRGIQWHATARAVVESGSRLFDDLGRRIDEAHANVDAIVAERDRLAAELTMALSRAADELEAQAKAVPPGDTIRGGGLDDAPRFDVMMWAARWMRARDQSHDGDDERSEGR